MSKDYVTAPSPAYHQLNSSVLQKGTTDLSVLSRNLNSQGETERPKGEGKLLHHELSKFVLVTKIF
jgi:hypothetical protein